MDVAVIGGGIVGCSAAAFLAEAGADVVLVERDAVAAGASGRNSGVLQHPLDPRLAALHHATLALHREVLDLRAEPDGILLVGATSVAGLPAEVEPELIADAAEAEPLVRRGTPAVRLRTGWILGPTAATQAWWRRAERAGARLVTGEGPPPEARRVLLATGAWTPGVTPVWGVTATVALDRPPRHVLEEAGVEGVAGGGTGAIFSLVGATLGSTFDLREPDPAPTAERMRERARRFVPALAGAQLTAPRACARPQSPDGLPLVGALPGGDGVFVCAGHGPWGISIGVGTARLVADIILGRAASAPPELDPAR